MKVSLPESKEVRAVNYPKQHERQFAQLMKSMTEAMATQYANNTLKKLNQKTIEKFDGSQFTDAQTGNYANIFLDLSKRVSRALLNRFSDDRLDKEVKRILTSMDRVTSETLYNNIGGVVGIDSKVISKQAGVTPQMNALIAESQEWVKRLRDENLALFQNATLRTMALGEGMPEIIRQYNELTKNRIHRAEFTARQQAATFNNMSQRIRAQKLGIQEGVWVTSRDERVRPSHQDREGKTYDVQVGLYSSVDRKTLKTGEDWSCRCVTRFIIPGISEETNEE